MERLDDEFAAACPICEGRGWVRRDVPVGHPDFGGAFPCACQTTADAERRLSRLHRYSNLGIMSQVKFENLDERGPPGSGAEAQARYHAALSASRAFADEPAGSLLLAGGHGTGKTRLAAAAASHIMERGVPVFFAFVPDLLYQLRTAYSDDAALPHDELLDQVKNVPVLVLDDIDAHSGTPWAEEKLFQIVNHRYVNGLPALITSAAPLERLDGRLQSKFADPRTGRAIDLGGAVQKKGTPLGSVAPKLRESMTFESFDVSSGLNAQDRGSLRKAFEASWAFADEFTESGANWKPWLVLIGMAGRGKTHLAVAVANWRLERGDEVFYAKASDLLDHLRRAHSPNSPETYDEVFDRIRQAPLLILDDFGRENPTPWANEKLYQIIVHRHEVRLPTMITMLPPDESPEGGASLIDRLKYRFDDTRVADRVVIMAPAYHNRGRQAAGRGDYGR